VQLEYSPGTGKDSSSSEPSLLTFFTHIYFPFPSLCFFQGCGFAFTFHGSESGSTVNKFFDYESGTKNAEYYAVQIENRLLTLYC
jgi:hypothetical protein